jgi:glycosyltransferase involved in cell wall biosynthesis
VITVTTYNDADRIESCIESCLAQRGPVQIAIVVADDGSTDATLAILHRLAAQADQLHILPLPHGERGRARAAAIEKALTLAPAFLLFIDSDMTLQAGLVQRCVAYARQHHYGALVIPEVAFSTSTNFFTLVKVFERNIINNAGAAYNGANSIEGARFWQTAAYLLSGGFHPQQIAFEETQPTLRYLARGGRVARATFTAIDHDEKEVTLRSLLAKKRYYFAKLPVTVDTEEQGFEKLWQRWFFFRPVLYRPANLYRYV